MALYLHPLWRGTSYQGGEYKGGLSKKGAPCFCSYFLIGERI
jgi:hypothetical protein